MLTIRDYVRFVADSMSVDLSNDKLDRIAYRLVKSEKYREMLSELEDMIQSENKVRWRRK